MDPDKIELENLSKSFEYFKLASAVDECKSIDELKDITKSYIKLYLKQQEVVSGLGLQGI